METSAIAVTGRFLRETLKRFVTFWTSSAGTAGVPTGPSTGAGLGAVTGIGDRAESGDRSCVIFGSWSMVLDIVGVPLGWRTWKSRDPNPVPGGWLAACQLSPWCSLGDK
jgi:hypothetical protein